MPTVAYVFGMKVQLFYGDHDPPHFHVEYGEHRARVSIATLTLLDGALPTRKKRRLLAWAAEHQEQLSQGWADVCNDRKPRRIE